MKPEVRKPVVNLEFQLLTQCHSTITLTNAFLQECAPHRRVDYKAQILIIYFLSLIAH